MISPHAPLRSTKAVAPQDKAGEFSFNAAPVVERLKENQPDYSPNRCDSCRCVRTAMVREGGGEGGRAPPS